MGPKLLRLRRDILLAIRRGTISSDEVVEFLRQLAAYIVETDPSQKTAVIQFRHSLITAQKNSDTLSFETLAKSIGQLVAIVGASTGNSKASGLLAVRRDLMMAARRSDETNSALVQALLTLVAFVGQNMSAEAKAAS